MALLSDKENMELYVWAGDEELGVPSMDLESLQMMLYVSLSGAPVTVTPLLAPYHSPIGTLPVFRAGCILCTSFAAMTERLRMVGYNCDEWLSSRQCADVLAYDHLLQEKLLPALSYIWWRSAEGAGSPARAWFYRHMAYPWRLWYPHRMQAEKMLGFEDAEKKQENPQEVLTSVLKDAQECLNALSERLGEQEHFMGRNASSMDARLVAYLALFFLVPTPTPALRQHILACPNLVGLMTRTLDRCFPDVSRPAPTAAASAAPTAASLSAWHHSPKRQVATFGLIAVAANYMFAKATGCWQSARGGVAGSMEAADQLLFE